jgi:hypothetical protein
MKNDESLAHRKLELAQWLLELDDETILQEIEELKKVAPGNWWDSLPDEDKASVERGLADIEAGRVSPQSEVMDRMRAWIKR